MPEKGEQNYGMLFFNRKTMTNVDKRNANRALLIVLPLLSALYMLYRGTFLKETASLIIGILLLLFTIWALVRRPRPESARGKDKAEV
jgi:hypothetical protein